MIFCARFIEDQAIAYDREGFLGVKLPTQDFPKPPPVANNPSTDGSPDDASDRA